MNTRAWSLAPSSHPYTTRSGVTFGTLHVPPGQTEAAAQAAKAFVPPTQTAVPVQVPSVHGP
jgi:hypothetical protein